MDDLENNKPLAAKGLTSYRCRGRFGWIMIGAKNDDDAYREALRSCEVARREDLQIWNDRSAAYVNVQLARDLAE